jgi:hypothetical protein
VCATAVAGKRIAEAEDKTTAVSTAFIAFNMFISTIRSQWTLIKYDATFKSPAYILIHQYSKKDSTVSHKVIRKRLQNPAVVAEISGIERHWLY